MEKFERFLKPGLFEEDTIETAKNPLKTIEQLHDRVYVLERVTRRQTEMIYKLINHVDKLRE